MQNFIFENDFTVQNKNLRLSDHLNIARRKYPGGYWSIPQTESQIYRQDRLQRAVNMAAFCLFCQESTDFNRKITEALEILGRSVNAERVVIWKNYARKNSLRIYRLAKWCSPDLPEKYHSPNNEPVPDDLSIEEILPDWERVLADQSPLYFIDKDIKEPFRSIALDKGIRSILIIPVFSKGAYWGFISFITYSEERLYSNQEKELLRSGGILIASAVENEETKKDLIKSRDAAEKILKILEYSGSDALNILKSKKNLFYSSMHYDRFFDRFYRSYTGCL